MSLQKILPGLLLVLLMFACIFGAGCTSDQKSYGSVTIDMCVVDPDNADIWPDMDVNLWKKPGGFAVDGQEIVASIPSCQGIEVEIVDITEYDGLTYYKIRYGYKEGWVTKRLATGEE